VQDVRQRRIVPFWPSFGTPAFIMLECLATSMRWLKTISKLIKNSMADSTPENCMGDHPIVSHKSIRLIRRHLQVKNIRYFHIRRFVSWDKDFSPVLGATYDMDCLLRRIPAVPLMAWQIAFEMANANKGA
jgi:hypothetical protein